MQENKAKELLKKHLEGTLTEQEKALLESWYLHEAKERRTTEKLDEPVPNRNWTKWYSIAACIFLVSSIAIYGWYISIHKQANVAVTESEILPGNSKARLILANGKSVVLDEKENGTVAQEGRTSIVKTGEGELVYEFKGEKFSNKNAGFNTIQTPKSGQFQVKLSDGTKVWLNSESSIRFPAEFNKQERLVEVSGEVYFEVNKAYNGSKRVPFKVVSGSQTVEVLGTRFNINSYADEGTIKTTLIEGSIQVSSQSEKKGVVLRPGQQSQLSSVQALKISEVNTTQVIAWKNGYFRFDGIGIKELMSQISRWYNIDVQYIGKIGEHEFVGEISRDTNLSNVLKILEAGGISCKIEGRKIIVSE